MIEATVFLLFGSHDYPPPVLAEKVHPSVIPVKENQPANRVRTKPARTSSDLAIQRRWLEMHESGTVRLSRPARTVRMKKAAN